EDVADRHQLFGFDAGVVAGGLRTVAAILWAAAGLDREQRAQLHPVVAERRAMGRLRAVDEIQQRQIVERADLGVSPVVSYVWDQNGAERYQGLRSSVNEH